MIRSYVGDQRPLDLDGQTLVVDPAGSHWVKFVVTRVPVDAVLRERGVLP